MSAQDTLLTIRPNQKSSFRTNYAWARAQLVRDTIFIGVHKNFLSERSFCLYWYCRDYRPRI